MQRLWRIEGGGEFMELPFRSMPLKFNNHGVHAHQIHLLKYNPPGDSSYLYALRWAENLVLVVVVGRPK